MASTPSPTWYDVLGVSRDASPEEIKAAWRTATDKFEPGSGSGGQFRMFNEAADVLLDPERRAAYDATLDGAPVAATADQEAEAPTDRSSSSTPPAAPGRPPSHRHRRPRWRTRRRRSRPASPSDQGAARRGLGGAGQPDRPGRRGRAGPAHRGGRGRWRSSSGSRCAPRRQVADARDEAPAAAERAAKAVLAYDYQTLPADRKRASAYLTDRLPQEVPARTSPCSRSRRTAPRAPPSRPRPWSPPPCSGPG